MTLTPGIRGSLSRSALALAVALLTTAAPSAQLTVSPGSGSRPDLASPARARAHARLLEKQRESLGLASLPRINPDSDRGDLLFADRDKPNVPESGSSPTIFNGFLPASETGTGKFEVFKFALGDQYSEEGAPRPMVVAYHGFGSSAEAVAQTTTLDEECNARGWVFMAPTGIDDQLFGPPLAQQNVEVAIQWMLDHFNIDPDRIYMVGFSMGAGVAANFAARHRDPDGIMLAALGMVSPVTDWTMSYFTSSPGLQNLMQNPYNFGGNPVDELFRYQQASALYFDPTSYLPFGPYPGTLVEETSMVRNLGDTPTYVAWDLGDPVSLVLAQMPEFQAQLSDMGGPTKITVGIGTPDPHSWEVADIVDMFDFFAGRSVDRTPVPFEALLDGDQGASFVTAQRRDTEAFATVSGDTDTGVVLTDVTNTRRLDVHLDRAGFGATSSVRVDASSGDAEGFTLALGGQNTRPAYVLDATTGELVTGTESDPLAGTIFTPVAGQDSVSLQVVADPAWTADITTTPDPAALGEDVVLDIDGPSSAPVTWLAMGALERLEPIKGGHVMTVALDPTTILFPLLSDAQGDAVVPFVVPESPVLSGQRLLMQTVHLGPATQVEAISNMWVMHFE